MTGCQVLIFTGFDPRFPVLRLIRGKVAAYNMHLRAIADRHGCHVVDLWAMSVLRDPRAWSADRLHLTPEAHRRVALRACRGAGRPGRRGLARALAAGGGERDRLGAASLAGGPADGRAVGPPARRALGGPPGARHLLRRQHRAQAPGAAPAVAEAAQGGWPRDHALADPGVPVDLRRLRETSRWMAAPAGEPSRQAVDRLLERAGGAPRVPWEFEGLGTIVSLVARGIGVAAVPRLALAAGERRVACGNCPSPARRATCTRWPGRPASAARAVI